jgi:hypothetical protein
MTRKIRYDDVVPGQWLQPIRRGYRLACCDCGLVHLVNFRTEKDKRGRHFIQVAFFRDERATGAMRRGPFDYTRKKKQ